MARKKTKVSRVSKSKHELTEIFAFGVIVFVIIILFSTIALAVSVKP